MNLLARRALIEDCLPFISRAQLHCVVLQSKMATLRAFFIHLCTLQAFVGDKLQVRQVSTHHAQEQVRSFSVVMPWYIRMLAMLV